MPLTMLRDTMMEFEVNSRKLEKSLFSVLLFVLLLCDVLSLLNLSVLFFSVIIFFPYFSFIFQNF